MSSTLPFSDPRRPCRGVDPEVFHPWRSREMLGEFGDGWHHLPHSGEATSLRRRIAVASAICARCPGETRAACLEVGLELDTINASRAGLAIYGGATPHERRRMRLEATG